MFSSINEFELNRNGVSTNQDFVCLIDSLTQIRDFLSELGYLAFGRDMSIFRRIGAVNGNIILDSATRTMESIRYCCMNANLADAYSLLRKYRDDLFYYVYLFAVADNSDFTQFVDIHQLNEDEKNIWDWVHNQQKGLHIGSVLKCIASHPLARKAVKDFKLKDSFDKLADKLNNYVHSNGRLFYNEPYSKLVTENKIKEECKELDEAAIFITMTFLFLVVLINPLLIMSYDYIDYLEVGDTPPDGSQYWVAPFVSNFINSHKDVLDERCDNYLREKTGMQI
ncbi:MAG: hypothetical protein HDR02_04285 [Lachnospiraceae bacterium]|nr:hypothetical protein [Lachnospiraceae bacterium]